MGRSLSYGRTRRCSPLWALLACTFYPLAVTLTVRATSQTIAAAVDGRGPARDFRFALCKGHREASYDAVDARFTVKTKLACWKECAQHPTCRSGMVCVDGTEEVMTCFLSPEVLSHCSALVPDSRCTSARLLDACQNDGVFDKFTMTCDCKAGWSGPLCESELTTATRTTEATTTDSTVPSTTENTTPESTSSQTIETTTVASTTLLPLPAPCFEGSAVCTADKAITKTAPDGTKYCCPSHASYIFQNCNPDCGPCFCS